MKRKSLVALPIFLLALGAAQAQPPAAERRQAADSLYRQGRFQEAAAAYEALTSQNPRDPFLWYDLANARFKSGALGPSIAAYLSAFRLRPRDPDLQYNLDFALRKEGESLYPDAIPKALWQAFYALSLTELEGAAWVFWWMAGLAATGAALWNRGRGALIPTAILAFFLAAGAGGWWALRSSLEPQRLGVIVKPGAELRNGPGENFSVAFTFPEGRRVSILNSTGGWFEVGVLKEGSRGWLPAESLQEVQ